MKNKRYSIAGIILTLQILLCFELKAQNNAFVGSWVSEEPVEITLEEKKLLIKGIDFLSANESPRYEGWLEEAVSYKELIDGEIRSGLTTFVYEVDEKESILNLKVIESQEGLTVGLILDFKFRFEENNNLILTIKNQEITLNSY
jgi:hypothetical protein